jgi:hypothetical protein
MHHVKNESIQSVVQNLVRNFKVVSSFLSERRENNTLYVENSVDLGNKEVYQLSTYIHKYKKRASTQVLCRRTSYY